MLSSVGWDRQTQYVTETAEGDFVGDGGSDDFMATGVTWWARSHATGQWRYLNTMTERLSNFSWEGRTTSPCGTWRPALPSEPLRRNGRGVVPFPGYRWASTLS